MTTSQVRQAFFGAAAVTGLALTWKFNLTYRGSARLLAGGSRTLPHPPRPAARGPRPATCS